MKAVFDTNIVIDALNGLEEAEKEYIRYELVYISRITWMEVLIGANESDEKSIRDFLKTHFDVLPIDEEVAEESIRLRRTYRMRLPDAIIWATARINGVELVSRNTKDFHSDWQGIRVPYVLG